MQAGLWLTGLSGLVELLYHMNLRTPRWMGYLVQRPEMHRLHHERGVHYRNFSDLPVWDMLFGTYANPPRADRPCGFLPEREARFLDMLLFRNVNGPYRGARRSP
jgi:sterol desaturase/sphingolipid hydroxylase (fatty acid hydroxylase superfamily)